MEDIAGTPLAVVSGLEGEVNRDELEANSEGLEAMEVNNEGLEVRIEGLEVRSEEALEVRRDGLDVRREDVSSEAAVEDSGLPADRIGLLAFRFVLFMHFSM